MWETAWDPFLSVWECVSFIIYVIQSIQTIVAKLSSRLKVPLKIHMNRDLIKARTWQWLLEACTHFNKPAWPPTIFLSNNSHCTRLYLRLCICTNLLAALQCIHEMKEFGNFFWETLFMFGSEKSWCIDKKKKSFHITSVWSDKSTATFLKLKHWTNRNISIIFSTWFSCVWCLTHRVRFSKPANRRSKHERETQVATKYIKNCETP